MKVPVEDTDDVEDIMKKSIEKLKLDYPARRCCILLKNGGEYVLPNKKVIEVLQENPGRFTNAEDPLLLQLPVTGVLAVNK